jgi:acid-sensing ion channel, other
LPLGATEDRMVEILPLLAGFVERQWAFPRIEDLEMIDTFLILNGMTVESAINQLGTVCSDFLLVCYFAGKKFPCIQNNKYLTFVESYTYLGACCSFNYDPKGSDEDEHFNVNSFGDNGGLKVIGTGKGF